MEMPCPLFKFKNIFELNQKAITNYSRHPKTGLSGNPMAIFQTQFVSGF
jgi:hypothetical protein